MAEKISSPLGMPEDEMLWSHLTKPFSSLLILWIFQSTPRVKRGAAWYLKELIWLPKGVYLIYKVTYYHSPQRQRMNIPADLDPRCREETNCTSPYFPQNTFSQSYSQTIPIILIYRIRLWFRCFCSGFDKWGLHWVSNFQLPRATWKKEIKTKKHETALSLHSSSAVEEGFKESQLGKLRVRLTGELASP